MITNINIYGNLVKALELDTTYSESYHALGGLMTWSKWDWKAGEAAFGKALELNPSPLTISSPKQESKNQRAEIQNFCLTFRKLSININLRIKIP